MDFILSTNCSIKEDFGISIYVLKKREKSSYEGKI